MESNAELAGELKLCLEETDHGCGFIAHPLVTFMGYDPTSADQTHMLNDWLRKKREAVRQAVEERNWGRVLMLHEKPYRLQALTEHGPAMTDEVYFHELGQVWMQVENLWRHRDDIPSLLSPPDRDMRKRSLMMTAEDRAMFEGLPDIVTIYRGCGPGNEDGWSWTLNLEQAKWFANRPLGSFESQFGGFVLQAECRRSSIIAYLGGREEDEIVINPNGVNVINRLSVQGDE